MSQPPKAYAVVLRQLAQKMRDTAGNINPTKVDAYPASEMKTWAAIIDRVAGGLEDQ